MKSYKGFDKNLNCRGFQFEIGGKYHHDGIVSACSSGFHACESPVDVLNYYAPANSRYAVVEQYGNISKHSDDSKIASEDIEIVRELTITEFVSECADCLTNTITDKASNSGYRSMASNSGYRSMASNSGYSSMAEVLASDSIAVVGGYNCKAKGVIGSWLVIAERDSEYKLLCVRSCKVDGKRIKENTWYTVKNGRIITYK